MSTGTNKKEQFGWPKLKIPNEKRRGKTPFIYATHNIVFSNCQPSQSLLHKIKTTGSIVLTVSVYTCYHKWENSTEKNIYEEKGREYSFKFEMEIDEVVTIVRSA